MRRNRSIRALASAFGLALLVPLVLWVGLPLVSGAASREDRLQSQIDSRRSREQSLSADAAKLSRLIDDLAGDVAVLERRLADVQAQLERNQAELARLQGRLRRQRARVARLKTRLERSRRALAQRLVAIYKSPRPDLVTVVVTSTGFNDLLERADFLRRTSDQDVRVVDAVRADKQAAQTAAKRLARLEDNQRRITDASEKQRNALAGMRQALAARQALAEHARAARLVALRSTRGSRQRLVKQLDKLRAEQARNAGFAPGAGAPSGPWAIPWPVVQCESGGQNLPPNWAGASGYYQIIPSTWRLFGGKGPAAYLTSKGEQDRVASLIWNGGAGAGNWDCYRLLRGEKL